MKKAGLCVLTAILLLMLNFSVLSNQIDDINSEKSNIQNYLDSLKKQQANKQGELSKESSNRKYLEMVQGKEAAQFDSLMKEVKRYDEEIKRINDDIKSTEDKYNSQMNLLKTRLKTMYENSNISYIQVLMESKNLVDLIERVKLISVISRNDKELLQSIEVLKKDAEYKKALKEDDKQATVNKAIDKQLAIKSIQVSRSDVETKINRINTEINKLAAQEDALLRKSKELDALVKSLQRSGGKYAGGNMIWPANGVVTSPYGNRLHPVLRVYRMHTGVDINAPNASAIFAANKGVVIFRGWQDGYGNTIIIDHGGGISTLYAHCSSILVSNGAEVEAGAIIGRVGSTGLSTGPHLHFEVRVNGATTDPLDYVSP